MGILLGLFLGKRLGVFSSVWLGVRAGIGFTMSLCIGTLAYADPSHMVGIRLGVLGGSILSACLGYLVLRLALSEHTEEAAARQGAYSS